MRVCILLLLLITHQSIEHPSTTSEENLEQDGDTSKKIIGSSVVTSVSVILNGNEPQFTDAIGKPIPKPMLPLQVASPINLLNPDRYEFYTFDDNGELVKRLMTLKEIQSIVANGDGDGAAIIHNVPVDDRDPEKNVQDIVQSVQDVLTKEVEWKKNASNNHLVLDTPDVSSSWSMILPAIFGNTGGDIFPQRPQQVVMTPDSDVVEQSSKPVLIKPSPSPKPISSPKPSFSPKPSSSPKPTSLPKPFSPSSKPSLSPKPKPTKQRQPTKRRPTISSKPISANIVTDFPHKIFVNNEEIIRPVLNRVNTTTTQALPQVFTSEKPKITSTTTKRVTVTKIKPTRYNSSPATKRLTTSSTSAPTTSQIKTTSVPRTTTSTTTETAIPQTIPTYKINTVRIPVIIPEATTTRLTTKPLPASTTSFSSSISTTSLPKTVSPTTILKTTEKTLLGAQIPTEQETDSTFDNVATYSTISSKGEEFTSPTDHGETTTLSINTILQSLSQSQEDLNTKLSFDQILESLKDEAHASDNTEPLDNNNQSTTHPIMYNGADALAIASHRHPTTEPSQQMETTNLTTSSIDEDKDYTTTEISLQSWGDNSTDNQVDGLNVVKYQPLYAELGDPILTDVTTILPTTEVSATTMEEDIEEPYPTQTTNSVENELKDITPTTVKLINSIKNHLTEAVDELVASNMNKFEEVSLSPQNVELVMESLKAGNISMSDFKQQAATAASNLENSQTTSPEAPTAAENLDEIESLLSDVLSQITNSPQPVKTEILKSEETSNRLSNFAHISPELFSGDLAYSDSKYEKLATIVPQGESNFNKNQISIVSSKVPHIKETSTAYPSIENSKDSLPHKPVGYASFETLLSTNKQDVLNSLKPLTSTQAPGFEYMESSTIMVDPEEPGTTELPESNQKLESENTSKYSDDKKEAADVNCTTSAYSDEDYTIENQTTDSYADSDDEKFSLISTTLMFPKNNSEGDETGSRYEDIDLQTMDLSTTPLSLAEENFSAALPDSGMESSTDVSDTMEGESLAQIPTSTSDIFNVTEAENVYVKLGEPMKQSESTANSTTENPITSTSTQGSSISRKPGTLKPVHYFKQPSPNDHKLLQFNSQRPVNRPPSLSNLKINQLNQATRLPVKLDPTPEQTMGLEASTLDLQEDVQEFARLCNELAFSYWKSITAEKISPARSLIMSPFALTSMLSMVFLGARGGTSGEMNEILRLDDMVTFNPHLVFKNITESIEHAKDNGISSSAFVREIFSDRLNGKILQFFKEKTQQLYSGHVEEVNFNVVNDIIRRRTNLLIKRHTMGKVMEYLRTNSVWVNGPLATVSANLFQTDCSRGSVYERDGEMFFQVHPSIRQRRLVPIPAVVFRGGFTAGYDPELDATVVAFGNTYETVSTIYIMPGQQGLAAPGDNLERLEHNLVDTAITKNSWSRLLTSLMERPGLEVQLPRFSHRSFINASMGLQRMGLKTLFNSDDADLRGLTGLSNKDVYLSDMIQINTFSTCAEEKITDHHHVEMYPAPPLRRRNAVIEDQLMEDPANIQSDFTAVVNDNGRAFYDDLLNPKYLELPLPLRPRQARIPDAPRLRFDKPFLYFVRHNPTGMILFMGRFNPRLLP